MRYGRARRGGIVTGIVFLLMGIIFSIIGGVFLGIYEYKKATCTLSTQGYVVDFEYDYDDDFSETKAPIVAYTVDGEDYMKSYNVYSNTWDFDIGDEIELLVNPDNPDSFILADSIWMQLTSGILLGIAGLFLLIAIILIIRHKKRIREANSQIYQTNQTYQPYQPVMPNSYTGASRHTAVHKDSYVLNGQKYSSFDTEQQGYYNLNGEIHNLKDKDPLS